MRTEKSGIAIWLLLAGLLFAATQVDAGSEGAAPPELGDVAWLRSYDEAAAKSASENKPIFLLFQEVPGCQTCVNFGASVLSHPLLIEAIEDEFVPLAILNNKGGADRKTLERFGEPAWNNPVVRFVDAKGDDLVPRKDRVWQPSEIASRMVTSLERANRPVPNYLAELRAELDPSRIESATLAMGCYWKGEACLGNVPGLLSTKTADHQGREVVEVRFDPARTSYAELLAHSARNGCADAVFAHNDTQLALARVIYGNNAHRAVGPSSTATPRNQKYHLKRQGKFAHLDLTPAQATRLNAAAWQSKDPTKHLSPRQQAKLK